VLANPAAAKKSRLAVTDDLFKKGAVEESDRGR
jgi:hypothetical protein